ncbi:hypothetical protein GBA52_011404 [Prunus armeniaca]|nr:hypothetical protein GBA52_011404 [Prunus armeniaca]
MDKKPKLETLNLSLALPEVSLSLSLTALNALQNGDPPTMPRPSRSVQSLAPSTNNTQTTCSNDFIAASLSYSSARSWVRMVWAMAITTLLAPMMENLVWRLVEEGEAALE